MDENTVAGSVKSSILHGECVNEFKSVLGSDIKNRNHANSTGQTVIRLCLDRTKMMVAPRN